MTQPSCVVFNGLGAMGEPMALNLAKPAVQLIVWNRSPSKSRILAGATVADDPTEVFAHREFVILMLRDVAVTDAVLARGSDANRRLVSGRTDFCHALYGGTKRLGLDGANMTAVISAIEQRTTAAA